MKESKKYVLTATYVGRPASVEFFDDFEKAARMYMEKITNLERGVVAIAIAKVLMPTISFSVKDDEREIVSKLVLHTDNSFHFVKDKADDAPAKYESSSEDEAYFDRNQAVLAMGRMALSLGYNVGIKYNEGPWAVFFIDLPTGQVSWHIPVDEVIGVWPTYEKDWDGHDLEEKRARMHGYFTYATEEDKRSKGGEK